MNSKRRRPLGKTPKPRTQVRSSERRVVLIDQGPIRRQAAVACQRELKKLEKARMEWRIFEQEDKPAFTRWMAATFGPLLTAIRTNAEQLRQKQDLIEEVEEEMFINGWSSYRRAYASILKRRERADFRQRTKVPPDNDPDESREEDTGQEVPPKSPQDIPKDQRKAMFEDIVWNLFGLDPEELGKREYERLFEDFQKSFFGAKAGKDETPAQAASAVPKTGPARLKEIYRILVRRLHPDTRADSDANVSAIWHEVQEAYAHGNIERLEMLLAMTDIQSESTGEHTTVSQMRAVLRELRSSLRALQRSLKSARNELAWNFRNANLAKLEARLRKQMESDVKRQEQELAELEALIASWSNATKRGAKRKSAKQSEFWM